MKYNKLSLMSHDLQDFEQEMKRTIEKYINSNFCFNNTQTEVPKCDSSQKSSLSTTCSNFRQVGMPVSSSTEKGFFQNFQSPSFNYEANNYGQNYNFIQNFQNKIAYDNLINYFRSQVAASAYTTPYPHNYNFGNTNLNHSQNFNFSGVPPCSYVNNMYGQYTCQPNDFTKFGNFQFPHLLNTNINSDTRSQVVNNNINNIIGTINSKNENTTKSEETTEEKLILNNKRKRETNIKIEDNLSEDSSSNFKNSRKITKCPHTDQKHYAKVKFFIFNFKKYFFNLL